MLTLCDHSKSEILWFPITHKAWHAVGVPQRSVDELSEDLQEHLS